LNATSISTTGSATIGGSTTIKGQLEVNVTAATKLKNTSADSGNNHFLDFETASYVNGYIRSSTNGGYHNGL
jgi:hypothetical protein